jgi:type II secretory pathway component PulM
MTRLLNRFNLQPQERRIVVAGAAVLFILLNVWLVRPHFGELGRVQASLSDARATLAKYRTELARTNGYADQLLELERQGSGLLEEDKDTLLTSTIQIQARQTGLLLGGLGRIMRGRTNDFFEQRSLTVTLQSTPAEQLVSFLVALATNDLVMRVKELDLKPDSSQTRLNGSLKVVASFQRKSLRAPPTAADVKPRPKS